MSFEKRFRPQLDRGRRTYPIQALTSTGAFSTGVEVAGVINDDPITTITSSGSGAGPWVFTMPKPLPGLQKTVLIQQNSTVPVTLQMNTSGTVLWGTTANNVLTSTLHIGDSVRLDFVGITTAAWSMPTGSFSTGAGVTIAGATQAVN